MKLKALVLAGTAMAVLSFGSVQATTVDITMINGTGVPNDGWTAVTDNEFKLLCGRALPTSAVFCLMMEMEIISEHLVLLRHRMAPMLTGIGISLLRTLAGSAQRTTISQLIWIVQAPLIQSLTSSVDTLIIHMVMQVRQTAAELKGCT